eukprot:7038067-Prymnesium_polylepis.1
MKHPTKAGTQNHHAQNINACLESIYIYVRLKAISRAWWAERSTHSRNDASAPQPPYPQPRCHKPLALCVLILTSPLRVAALMTLLAHTHELPSRAARSFGVLNSRRARST